MKDIEDEYSSDDSNEKRDTIILDDIKKDKKKRYGLV